MTSIALFGAGGKMGYRLASNLKGAPFEVRHVEISEAGKRAAVRRPRHHGGRSRGRRSPAPTS